MLVYLPIALIRGRVDTGYLIAFSNSFYTLTEVSERKQQVKMRQRLVEDTPDDAVEAWKKLFPPNK